MSKVVLLNSSIMTSDGLYQKVSISMQDAVDLIRNSSILESYIGHPATAEFLSKATGRDIPVNRGMYSHKVGDVVVVVSLNKRLDQPGDLVDNLDQQLTFSLVRFLG